MWGSSDRRRSNESSKNAGIKLSGLLHSQPLGMRMFRSMLARHLLC